MREHPPFGPVSTIYGMSISLGWIQKIYRDQAGLLFSSIEDSIHIPAIYLCQSLLLLICTTQMSRNRPHGVVCTLSCERGIQVVVSGYFRLLSSLYLFSTFLCYLCLLIPFLEGTLILSNNFKRYVCMRAMNQNYSSITMIIKRHLPGPKFYLPNSCHTEFKIVFPVHPI